MKHCPGPGGWEFKAKDGKIQGGGRTLSKCIDSSEHATRNFLSRDRGYDVPMAEARDRIRHAFSCIPI